MRVLIVLFLLIQTAMVRAEVGSASQESIEATQFSGLVNLVNNICTKLSLVKNSGAKLNIGIVIEDYVLSYNEWNRETPSYRKLVSQFLNENSSEFVCRNNLHVYAENQIFKRAVDMQMYTPVLTDFFLQADEQENNLYDLDFNTVTVSNWGLNKGEPETLLDYLDAILARPDVDQNYDVGEIRELRETLVLFFGAKNARDLQ